MAKLTPVYVGSIYGRTSSESFLEVVPSGLMTLTKSGYGIVGFKCGKYCDCSSIIPSDRFSRRTVFAAVALDK